MAIANFKIYLIFCLENNDKSLLVKCAKLSVDMWRCRCLSVHITKAQHQKKSLIPHAGMLLNQRQLNSATKHWLTKHKPDPMRDDIRNSKSCGEVSEKRILGYKEIDNKKERKNKTFLHLLNNQFPWHFLRLSSNLWLLYKDF